MNKVGKRRTRRARRVVIAVAAAAAVGTAAAAAAGIGLTDAFGQGSSSDEGNTSLPPSTAQITQQTIVDTKVVSGDLGYGDAKKLSARLRGTLTSLADADSTVSRGKAIYRVDDTPVVLLYGSLPAYRALSSGTEGADVKQFERNLHALGYRGFTVDDYYSASTAYAVKRWQGDLGIKQTGKVELGRVFYAPGVVRVESHEASNGDAVGSGVTVLTYTGTSKVVTVEVPYEYRHLTKTGSAVTVTLPEGKSAPAKVSHSKMVIKPAESSEDSDTTVMEVAVTLNDPKKVAELDAAALDVAFTVAERKDVLTVPVAALLALPKGGYGVELVDGDRTRTVRVKTGLFASGRVEISGDSVTEGAKVGVPE